MKLNLTEEWWMNAAKREGGHAVGVGRPAMIKREAGDGARPDRVLIKREAGANLKLLDEPGLPPRWDGPHVGMRITEGFVTFRSLPLGDKGGASAAWPAYMYEWEDLLAQQAQGELERTMQLQNRTRVSPSVTEITRAIEVCYWPAKYLSVRHPQLCEAVNAVALAHALDRDAGWVTRKRGGYADTWRTRHDHGCEIIAAELTRDRVLVF
jgi:hypothetical protein